MPTVPRRPSPTRATLAAVLVALALTGGLVFYLTRDASPGGAGPATSTADDPSGDATPGSPGDDDSSSDAPAGDTGAGRFDAAAIVSFRSLVTSTVGAIQRCAARRGDGQLAGSGGPDCLSPATLRQADSALARADLRVGSATTRATPPRQGGSVWVFPIIDRSPGTPTSGLVGGYAVAGGIPTGAPGTRAPIAWFVQLRRPNGSTARTCAIGGGITGAGQIDGRGRTHPTACPTGRW